MTSSEKASLRFCLDIADPARRLAHLDATVRRILEAVPDPIPPKMDTEPRRGGLEDTTSQTPNGYQILRQKPRDNGTIFLVDRGGPCTGARYVTAWVDGDPEVVTGWFWGSYFDRQDEAERSFENR